MNFEQTTFCLLAIILVVISCANGQVMICSQELCDFDCTYQHCSPTGNYCDEHALCRCGPFTECPGNGVQCRSQFPPARGKFFRDSCNWDCRCNHGADDGICDFAAKGCKCGNPNNVADCTTEDPMMLSQVSM